MRTQEETWTRWGEAASPRDLEPAANWAAGEPGTWWPRHLLGAGLCITCFAFAPPSRGDPLNSRGRWEDDSQIVISSQLPPVSSGRYYDLESSVVPQHKLEFPPCSTFPLTLSLSTRPSDPSS